MPYWERATVSRILRTLTPEEFAAKLRTNSDVMILDVRTEEEWRTGHLERARLLPMHALVRRVEELNPAQETVVVCQRGIRSDFVAQYLVAIRGFQNVALLCGGMNAWQGIVTVPNPEDCP
jgi:rhodanese-related sulfurtransferase